MCVKLKSNSQTKSDTKWKEILLIKVVIQCYFTKLDAKVSALTMKNDKKKIFALWKKKKKIIGIDSNLTSRYNFWA